jgi:glycosyltransferase involved in cell wall biosynthesis
VIIPTYRRERLVLESIASALAQTGVLLEVIVLDDTDEGTAREGVAQLGDARVRYVKRAVPSRGKPALVRNDGLEVAGGRYLHFLDDDDRLASGALAALAGALDRRPNKGVALGVVEPFGDDPAVLARQRAYFEAARASAKRTRGRLMMSARLLFKTTLLVNSVCMVRREIARKVGGYDPDIQVCEDVEFYLRAIRAGGFVFVDRTVLHYRTGAPSIMHDLKDAEKIRESYARFYAKYKEAHGRAELYALKLLAKAL